MKKNFLKCAAASTAMTLVFAMGAQAAVKSVTITQPTKKASYNVYKAGKTAKKTVKVTVKTTKKTGKKVTFASSNKKVATVTSKGVVTFKKLGKVKITVTSKADKTKKDVINFKVYQGVTKVTAKAAKTTLNAGESTKITTTVAPKTAKKKKLSFSSSNKKVATVDKNGNVKAVAAGTATITVKSTDGTKKKATVKITVNAPATADVKTYKFDVAKTFTTTQKYNGIQFLDTTKAAQATEGYFKEVAKNLPATQAKEVTVDGKKYTVELNATDGLKVTNSLGNKVATEKLVKAFNGSNGLVTVAADKKLTESQQNIILQLAKTPVDSKLTGSYNFGNVYVTTAKGEAAFLSDVTVSKDGYTYTEAGKKYTLTFGAADASNVTTVTITAPAGAKAEDSIVAKYIVAAPSYAAVVK